MQIYRNISEPLRKQLDWDGRWNGSDNGLITCWEAGREEAVKNPEVAAKARAGALVVLPWVGGVKKSRKSGEKEVWILLLSRNVAGAIWTELRH